MKTPDEIKKGLVEAIAETFWAAKDGDAHDLKDACDVAHTSMTTAMIYIQHLEAERDAAVKDIYRSGFICKNFGRSECLNTVCAECAGWCNWEWRGVQKEDSND